MALRPAQDRYTAPLMLIFEEPHLPRRSGEKRSRREEEEPQRGAIAAPPRARSWRDIRNHFLRRLDRFAFTVDLASARDLSAHPRCAASILNEGLPDVTAMSAGSLAVKGFAGALHAALLRHDPRLVPETLVVTAAGDDERREAGGFDGVSQHLRFTISGELSVQPEPIPVSFDAEFDPAAGKLAIAVLGVPS